MRKGDESGFTLVEAMIAMAMVTGVAYMMATVILNGQKGAKSVDLKAQSQDFYSALRLMLGSADRCKQALFIGSGNPLPPDNPVFANLPGTDPASPAVSHSLAKIGIGNTDYSANSAYGDLLVQDISLNFPPALQTNQYLASLAVTLVKKPSVQSLGASVFVQSIPIYLTVSPLGGNQYALSSCWISADSDPEATCKSLGGQWLKNVPSYMPAPRCNFGNTISLRENEFPDILTDVMYGGATASGLRVETCHKQNQGRNSTTDYQCPGNYGNKAGYRCIFDPASHQWAVVYFDAGTTSATPRPIAANNVCRNGVEVSTKGMSIGILDWNRPLESDFSGAPTSGVSLFNFRQDGLAAISRCQYMSNSDTYYNCLNTTDLAGAQAGKTSSCIWVEGGVTITNSADLKNCVSQGGVCPSATPASYTGWIYSKASRVIDPNGGDPGCGGGSPGSCKYSIRESGYSRRNVPCYAVEYDPSLVSVTTGLQISTSGPGHDLNERPAMVQECLLSATTSPSGAPPTGSPSRMTTFACDNTGIIATNDPIGGTGMEGWDGANGAAMPKGSCWYFKPGVPPATLKINGQVFGGGWVYLTGALNASKFASDGGALYPTSAQTLAGYPCNAGIRYE